MSTWYSLDLGDGMEAFGPTIEIKKAFWPLFTAAGQPENMGVFSKYDLEANMVTAYFPPITKTLARIFNAKECDKPSSNGIAFMVGAGHCLEIYFPDRPRR